MAKLALADLKRRKVLFDAAMASGYGLDELPMDSSMDLPHEPRPEDDGFVDAVLEQWSAIVAVLERCPG